MASGGPEAKWSAIVALYCTCGETFLFASVPESTLELATREWQSLHSGAGHALTDAETCLHAREKWEREKDRSSGDRAALSARELTNQGIRYAAQKRTADALDCFERSLRLAEQRGDDREQMRALAFMGAQESLQGNDAEALSLLERALGLARKLEDEASIVVGLNAVGHIHVSKGRDSEALASFEASLRLAEKLRDEPQQARILLNLGALDFRRSEYGQALSRLQRAADIADRLGLPEREQIHKMRADALNKTRPGQTSAS